VRQWYGKAIALGYRAKQLGESNVFRRRVCRTMCVYTVVQHHIGQLDGCVTPAKTIEVKSPAGDRCWKVNGRSRLIEEFTCYG
jgi:hypothetical protein